MICAIASSETRAASPFSTSSLAERCRSAAYWSIQPYSSFARGASACTAEGLFSDDDIDIAVLLLELGFAQLDLVVALIGAGLEIELVAVPRADDIGDVVVVGEFADRAVTGDRLDDAFVDAALAHGSRTMRTFVVPGDKLA